MLRTSATWLEHEAGPLASWLSVDDSVPYRGAALLLPAIGYQYWSTSGALRDLADDLARSGVASLRIDYHGTGDSAGSGWEDERLEAWRQSVAVGLASLRAARPGPVGIVGLQLGALLGLSTGEPLDFVVGWQPVLNGRRFRRELTLMSAPIPDTEHRSFAGFPLAADLMDDLAKLKLAPTAPIGSVLLLADPQTDLAAAAETLAAGGAAVSTEQPADAKDVFQVPTEEASTPRDLVERIVAWVGEAVGLPASETPEAMRIAGSDTAVTAWDGGQVRERVVRLTRHNLVGVLGTPDDTEDQPGVIVVFLNSGSEPHVGSGRAWVEYSRALNLAGVAALRLDWSGWGESPDLGHRPGRPYDEHCLPETIAVVQELQQQGYQVVLAGLCASAWVAMRAAQLVEVDGVAAINPQLYWSPGDPVEALMTTTIARRAPARIKEQRGARYGVWSALDRLQLRNTAGRWLADLDHRRRSVALLFAQDDEGLGYLRTRLGRQIRRLDETGRITVHAVPEIDHSMHRSWLRPPMVAELLDFSLLVAAQRGVSAPSRSRGLPGLHLLHRHPDANRINAATFDDPSVVATYTDEGWTDLGERKVAGYLRQQYEGSRVLDIGVGTGRTSGLLTRRLSADYVGVDYAPHMVQACQARHPELDIRVGDARDLSDFESGAKDVVVFSYNGLDAISHADRQSALAEMARVLSPSGRLWYSTLNLDSWYAGSKPWLIGEDGLPLTWRPAGWLPWLRGLRGNAPRYWRRYRNWFQHRGGQVSGPDWAVRHLQAHDFGILAHYVNLAGIHRELAAHGLVADRIVASSGDEIDLTRAHSDEPYFHIVARRTVT